MDEFHKTRMGQRFYERTMPELVQQIERLNELLERLVRQTQPPDREQSPVGASVPKAKL